MQLIAQSDPSIFNTFPLPKKKVSFEHDNTSVKLKMLYKKLFIPHSRIACLFLVNSWPKHAPIASLFYIHVQRKLTNLHKSRWLHFHMLLSLSQVAFNITNTGKAYTELTPAPSDCVDKAKPCKGPGPRIMNPLVTWHKCERILQTFLAALARISY